MRLSNNEIDEGKLTYDLALLCTKRYLDEVKFPTLSLILK